MAARVEESLLLLFLVVATLCLPILLIWTALARSPRRKWYDRTVRLVGGVSFLVALIALVYPCPRFHLFRSEFTARDADARQWIRFPQGDWWRGVSEDSVESQFREVGPDRVSSAESLLATRTWAPLTSAQPLDLLAGWHTQTPTDAVPYLLRGVSEAGGQGSGHMKVLARPNGDVLVSSLALSHCPVLMQRRPVVAWLQRPPRTVYVIFSVSQ